MPISHLLLRYRQYGSRKAAKLGMHRSVAFAAPRAMDRQLHFTMSKKLTSDIAVSERLCFSANMNCSLMRIRQPIGAQASSKFWGSAEDRGCIIYMWAAFRGLR